ncbi:MAG: hypothetical protein ACREC6_06520 [Hyphomicrobiaceae bacterium]
MSVVRGLVIRILELMCYLGIVAATVAGAAAGAGSGRFAPILLAIFGGPGTAAIVGAVVGFFAGSALFGVLLVLIDIRENTRRDTR